MPSSLHENDLSNGWEAIAKVFISYQTSNIGAAIVKDWAKSFGQGAEVLDVGCGFGGSYTNDLNNRGLKVYGVDTSTSGVLNKH
jgi:2-polyprenyl-3-methyl-5-hydroxy-6-metoxy-1,4-benzoquinol methylase